MLTSEQLKEYLPKISYSEASSKYEAKGATHYDNFKLSYRAIKNDFFRKYIYFRQIGVCPICDMPILDHKFKAAVHHTDYNHECDVNSGYIKVAFPTDEDPYHTHCAPNCELCFRIEPKKFEECSKKAVIVHHHCHQKIHEQEHK